MKEDRGLSIDSTIYNYTLLRKIKVSPSLAAIYSILPAVFLLWILLFVDGRQGLAAFISSCFLVPLLHVFLIRTYSGFTKKGSKVIWSLHRTFPWVGYMPANFIGIGLFSRLHVQLTVVGSAAIALGYAWLPPCYFLSLLFIHLWLLFPRLWITGQFKKTKPGDLLRIQSRDVFVYRP